MTRDEILKRANNGCPDAQYQLGLIYSSYKNEKVKSLGVTWFEQAAKNGSPEAQYELGLYFLRYDQEGDLEKAMEWFTESAENGFVKAQSRLGLIYFSNEKLQCYENAFHWFMVASVSECCLSFYYLALMYKNGYFVEEDPLQYYNNLHTAYALGYKGAQKFLQLN